MITHAHRLAQQMLVVIAHEMLELADMRGHSLCGRAGSRSTTGLEDLLMGCDHVLAIAERVPHPVKLAMRQQTDRAPERLEHPVAAGARDDAVKDTVLGDECRLVVTLAFPIRSDRLGRPRSLLVPCSAASAASAGSITSRAWSTVTKGRRLKRRKTDSVCASMSRLGRRMTRPPRGPGRCSSTPCASRIRIPSRNVGRLTSNCCNSSASVAKVWPGSTSESAIRHEKLLRDLLRLAEVR